MNFRSLGSRVARKVLRTLRYPVDARPATPPEPPVPVEQRRIKLRFTGTCGREEFEALCQKHDYWYHSYYFDNGFVQRGDYDIGADVAEYRFPQSLKGLKVLDIGTGSGWFATYFEQQGAEVTVTDLRGRCDFDLFGRDHYPNIAREKTAPDRVLPNGRPVYYSSVSRGFWIMKDILGLKADYINARIYEICPELFGGQKFDLVFLGSVLMHVRDPIGALMAAHSVCRHQLIATTYVTDSYGQKEPLMQMNPWGSDGINWWVPNEPCLRQWLRGAGFRTFDIANTVRLTVDKPFTDANGRCTAVNQVQRLVHAFV